MALSLEETQLLIEVLGITVDEALIEGKLQAKLFKERKEKITVAGASKPGDWPLKQKFDEVLKGALELAAKDQWAPALATLDQVEQILKQEPVAENGVSLVNLQKSRLAWDNLRKRIQKDLEALEQSILSEVRLHNQEEGAEELYDETQLTGSVKRLYSILDGLDGRLVQTLDEALNAQEPSERQRRHVAAAEIIKEYQKFVSTDRMLAEIDNNGFLETNIRDSVTRTLTQLSARF